MVKKMLELTQLRGAQINLIIYDPKLHKIEEIYSHESASLASINKLIANPRESNSLRKRKRYLKHESHDARVKYRFDEKELDGGERDSDSEGEQGESMR